MDRFPPHRSFPAPPFDQLERFAGRPAVIDEDGEVLSYEAFLEQADAIGAKLSGRALVMVVCRNDVECLGGYVGLSRAGAALLLVHHSLPQDRRQAIVDAFRPHLIWAPAEDKGGYSLTPTGHAADFPIHDDLCLLLTTSGTTGSRSFVRLSHDNVVSNAQAIIDYLGITPDERAITTMPMSYTYGLSIIHSHLMAGASVIATDASLVSPDFWKILKSGQATSFGGVPFLYEMLQKLRFERMELPHLKTLTQAGGKLGADLTAKFIEICRARQMRFITMYGQTEATARMSFLPWEHAAEKAGSIGVAIPGGRLWLADKAGHPIEAANTTGQLVYEGPNVSLGYAEGWADLARGDDNKGRLFTGDLAQRDEDGFFRIVGRMKRFLKIVGHRVNLDEVEQIIKRAGHDCACGGEDNMLRVHLAKGGDAAAVKALVVDQAGLNPNSFEIVEVDAIPRNDAGKTDYQALAGFSADR